MGSSLPVTVPQASDERARWGLRMEDAEARQSGLVATPAVEELQTTVGPEKPNTRLQHRQGIWRHFFREDVQQTTRT